MKKIVIITLFLILIPLCSKAVAVYNVKYYIRNDGIEVDSYYRTAPDGYAYNNLSEFKDEQCKSSALIQRNSFYERLKATL